MEEKTPAYLASHRLNSVMENVLKIQKWISIAGVSLLTLTTTATEVLEEASEAEQIFEMLKTAETPEFMMIPFKEIRQYRLKKTAMIFEGNMRLNKEKGISIEYTSPTPRVFILDQSGLVIRDPEKGVEENAPEQAREVISVFLDLLKLDTQRLYEQFEISVSETQGQEQETWIIELIPKERSLINLMRRIELQGHAKQLDAIFLKNGRDRWRRFEFLAEPQEWDPTETNLKAFF